MATSSSPRGPVLGKVQLLRLSPTAVDDLELPPPPPSQREPPTDQTPESRLLQFLAEQFVTRAVTLRQHGFFEVPLYDGETERIIFIVVDLETIPHGSGVGRAVSYGILTEETSIFCNGHPIEVLTHLNLSLVRRFPPSSFSTPVPQTSLASGQEAGSSSESLDRSNFSFRSFFRRHLGRSRRPQQEVGSAAPRPSVSHYEVPESVIDLGAVLLSVLRSNPCTTFIPGRTLLFELPTPLVDYAAKLRENEEEDDVGSGAILQTFVVGTNSRGLPGVINLNKTLIDFEVDGVGEFNKIQFAPLSDTISEIYSFDLMDDYIRPFANLHPFQLYSVNTIIKYHGVELKVQKSQPEYPLSLTPDPTKLPDSKFCFWKPHRNKPLLEQGNSRPLDERNTTIYPFSQNDAAEWRQEAIRIAETQILRDGNLCRRIGRLTRVYCGEPVLPHWTDRLPPQVVAAVRRAPARLQPFALIYALSELAPETITQLLPTVSRAESENQRLAEDARTRKRLVLSLLDEYATTYEGGSGAADKQNDDEEEKLCVVCLSEFEKNDRILQLPCNHFFHFVCGEEWIQRSLHCPICKLELKDVLEKQNTNQEL